MKWDSLLYKDSIKLRLFSAESDSNTSSLGPVQNIMGLRLKGHYSFTTGTGGDSSSTSIVYRIRDKIPKKSTLDGHVVMDCVRVDSHLPDAGYLCYCK